ncbi:NADH-quinone oxidoreductase subunit NuoG [Foetidibacter luteolus]|uniref:NADH-quinone oxidoreductase subunit NuoG n=1 Tax=Foetidibacter luteolus TaxID=2608880 RepID=UPI001F296673|nr:NADH-quinone oxidoreductase subunit NuoG [Foetidibacter luteolus]
MTIYIDNKPYEAKAGKNLLEACLAAGINLPYFCWHPSLGSVGACRQCAVKVFKDEKDTQGRLVMSCMEGVRDGVRIGVEEATAKAFREQVIEWMMTNHPHDCPVCDEGGSCHLQDMTVMTGHDYRRYHYKKRTYKNQYLGPLINHEMNRCIQCYRCVRYYHDYAGGDDLNVFAAHNHVYFGRDKDGVLQSPFSGNLAEVCPTGVFTDKTLKEHYTRKWDLTMAPSVCTHCSVGCNITAGERYGKLRCVVNRYNEEVNGYFLCDRGRFGYEFVNSENRVTQPLIRGRMSEAVSEEELMHELSVLLSQQKLVGIGSARASLESNFALRQLVGAGNFYAGISETEAYLTRLIVQVMQEGTLHSASLKDIEQADAVIVLGEDVWNTAPMMALAVRQAAMKTAANNAAAQLSLPAWHDAAIKELVQTDKGFLANITVAGSPIDNIAQVTVHAVPDDIARLGFAVAHELSNTLPALANADEKLLQTARQIAAALQQSKHPVIVSGLSCVNSAVIRAAFDIAAALNNTHWKASVAYVLPECNSMGLALMQAPSAERIFDSSNANDMTALILENDLYRYLPQATADAFFSRCSNVIALDSIHNNTTEKAQVLIPAATFAEADGSMVNYEGRTQHYYKVFIPKEGHIKESFHWLNSMRIAKNNRSNGHGLSLDELLHEAEIEMPVFEGVHDAMLSPHYSIHGEHIPREPHRYSGRTAMYANLNVSEQKPLQEEGESAFGFTMEGFKGQPPADAAPFFWSPGWNSGQSVTKYQQEPGGAFKGHIPAVQLFHDKVDKAPVFFKDIPEAFVARKQKWLVLPQYHVLASGELSSYTKALASLLPEACVVLSETDAALLGVRDGDKIRVHPGTTALPVKVHLSLANGVVLISAGLPGTEVYNWGDWVKIEKE